MWQAEVELDDEQRRLKTEATAGGDLPTKPVLLLKAPTALCPFQARLSNIIKEAYTDRRSSGAHLLSTAFGSKIGPKGNKQSPGGMLRTCYASVSIQESNNPSYMYQSLRWQFFDLKVSKASEKGQHSWMMTILVRVPDYDEEATQQFSRRD